MTAPDPMLASALMVVLETTLDKGTDAEQQELVAMAWDEVRDRLAAGAEVNGLCCDPYQTRGSLLSHAIAWRREDVAELLLAHGADPTDPLTGHSGTYGAACGQPRMIRLLIEHGADPTLFDREDMVTASGADRIPAQTIPPGAVHLTRAQRGSRNPQPLVNPFYIEQIRSFDSAYGGLRRHFGQDVNPAPWALSPTFSFDRFGRTVTRLPDGRLVLIAGEHEDHYDPDFFIYNDVCVLDGAGGVEYFLYPVEDFPPTDFHSATLVGDHILIIGGLGYRTQRQVGVTQVFRLDLPNWRVSRVETKGDTPGWIHRHRAELQGGQIIVSGGCIEPGFRANHDRYALSLRTMRWHRIS